jgi:hypothetical protein
MAAAPPDDSGFLSRWSRRKVLVRQGVAPAEPVVAPPVAVVVQPDAQPVGPPQAQAAPLAAAEPAPAAPPPPTLADVALLTRDSDYTRFVAPGVDTGVKNAAMKKLFADPHYNLMDGLDTYIDDYGKPDPIPPDMLRGLVQSRMLGLFDDQNADDKPAAVTAALPAEAHPYHDEDPAVQLQPDDAAGSPVGEPGGEDAGGDPAGQR